MIARTLQTVIEERFFQGKAIVLVGPRQVGKTTLLQAIADKQQLPVLFLNCDEPETRNLLTNVNTTELKLLIAANKLVIIDEAQKVDNIGLTLKLIVDNFKEVQVVASGSSAFDLRSRLNEPLTGRKFEYHLYPIATQEIVDSMGLASEKKIFESRLIYGSYPDIINRQEDAKVLLMSLVDSYLYKDILSLSEVRKPALLDKLLVALALQVGSEVSYNELAQTIQSDSKTVEKYINLLEKCFVVFRLNGLSRNSRNELKKSKKIYFYDNGVRNAIIQNFTPLALRQDTGALWENFMIAERIKRNHYQRYFVKIYFWRTIQQQEIDFVEEADGEFTAFELKWNENKKINFPSTFLNNYRVKETAVITPKNYLAYLTLKSI
jgi:uncharacterized protein